MTNLKLAFLTFLFALTTTANAATAKFNQKRSITLSGVVNESTLVKANQLLAFAETSKEPVDILIASPGGAVSYGLYFIQAMQIAQGKGVVIRCFVPHLAASMAFTIFTQCDRRYALPYAQLLFHSPRIQGEFLITPDTAERLAMGLRQLEGTLLKMIIPAMGVTKELGGEWFMQSYYDERLFIATDLLKESPKKWFTIVSKIEGAGNLYPNAWGERQEMASDEDRANYVYIYRN